LRLAAALAGVALLVALPAGAADPAEGSSAAELERAIARIRAQVESQRAATGAAAVGQAAERSAEIDRLAAHLAALERDNRALQARNAELVQALQAARRRGNQLEREKEALAKQALARLDALPDAAERLEAARGEVEAVARLLEEVATAPAQPAAGADDEPLPRLEAPGAGGGPPPARPGVPAP
jgi:small-conductance mechanosensitive channel